MRDEVERQVSIFEKGVERRKRCAERCLLLWVDKRTNTRKVRWGVVLKEDRVRAT